MRAKINKRSVRALEPDGGGQTWLHDTELAGFSVLCQASGRKTYMVRYKMPGGHRRRMILAACSEIDPDEAREMARDALATARRGDDPARDRSAPTLKEYVVRFKKEHQDLLKPKTREDYELLWKNHILPRLGHRKVVDIDEADVLALRNAMKKTPTSANRALALLSKALNMAELWKYRPKNSNPCIHVERFKLKARTRALADHEIARLWEALDQIESDMSVPICDLIRLLMLTGCRKSEWLNARWEWFDARDGVLHLPDTKTGGRDVYLPAKAIDILARRRRLSNSDLILPGRLGGPMKGEARLWAKIRRSAGIDDGVRLHDLRHTVGSQAARAGMDRRGIADLLGHRQLSTTEIYINSVEDSRRSNADAWGEQLGRLTQARADKSASGGDT